MHSLPAVGLPAAACLWILLLGLAPVALARGTLPAGTLAVYRSTSILCHQKAERSFRIARTQMPVCARCFGLYLAGAAGAVAAYSLARRRASPSTFVVRLTLLAAAVPLVLSVGLEWLGVVEGSNISRFVSALPLGITAGWLLQLTVAGTARRSGWEDAISF
jgi:uncharacterized membrane protein